MAFRCRISTALRVQIMATFSGDWYRLARKEIDQQIVHGSEG
jgi:hypothetical protein